MEAVLADPRGARDSCPVCALKDVRIAELELQLAGKNEKRRTYMRDYMRDYRERKANGVV